MSDNQTRVQTYLEANPYSTTNEIAAALGISPSTARRHLRALRQLGKLRNRTRWRSRHQYTIEYWIPETHRSNADTKEADLSRKEQRE